MGRVANLEGEPPLVPIRNRERSWARVTRRDWESQTADHSTATASLLDFTARQCEGRWRFDD